MSGQDKNKEEHDEHRLIAQRRQKLDEMRKGGFHFPNDRRRTSVAGELHANCGSHSTESLEKESIEVSIGGRLMVKRVMGKAAFAKVQDRTGQMQIYVQRDVVSTEVYKDFKSWDLGDIVWVRGKLFKTRTGELTVNAEEIVMLAKCLRPLPEKFHGLADQEMRYRQRYVDLIVNEESRQVFKARTAVVQHLRAYLDAMGFMEVETPMMQAIPGGAVARPFITHHNALDRDLYLRIAPELYLKRLIVGGFERVYEINRSFRNEGVSTQHNPEFTMLELYMAFADYEALMDMLENMIRTLSLSLHGGEEINYQGKVFDLARPFRRLSVIDAVAEYNPDLDPGKLRDEEYLRSICTQLEIKLEKSYGSGKLLIEIFEKTVENKLDEPTFITGYPAEVSPLARRSDDDPWLTDRFELFIAGREIANGFSELNDPEDQAERFRAQVEQKNAGDVEAMFYDDDYITALEYGMPPTAGLGVGIDRLVMFMTDMPSIRDVLLFPHLRDAGK